MFEQCSAHEHVVVLFAVFCLSEPLPFVVLLTKCVSSDVFGVDCSDLRFEVSANQHARVRNSALFVVLLELGVHLLGTPVSLGPECCTALVCLVHLLRVRFAFPWHVLLFPVSAKVHPDPVSVFVDRDRVPVSPFEIFQLLDELVDPVVACQRARAFLDHRDFDRFLKFAVESLRAVWFVVLCVGVECRGSSLSVVVALRS